MSATVESGDYDGRINESAHKQRFDLSMEKASQLTQKEKEREGVRGK